MRYSAYPYVVDSPTPYGNDAYCASGMNGSKARVVLPAFSTIGISSATLEIPLYCKDKEGEFKIYASSYLNSSEFIGSYTGTAIDGFKKCRFELPEHFLNQKWVELIIDGEFNSADTEEILAFGPYKVVTLYPQDIAVLSIEAPRFLSMGEPCEIYAEVENNGTLSAEIPTIELEIRNSEKIVATLQMESESVDPMQPLDNIKFTTKWTPSSESGNSVEFVVRNTNADMNPSNDEKRISCHIAKDNCPVVTDLSATLNDEEILLSWTDPNLVDGIESFETMAPFSYGERIGEFRTIQLDDYESEEFVFDLPYMKEPKAWQVINSDEIEKLMNTVGLTNELFIPASGEQCLMAVPPYTVFIGHGLVSDRWLITPSLLEGSKVKFKLCAGETGYVEKVEILVSNSDDNPENFVLIDSLDIISSGWKTYEYVLPEEARYLAIRYCGDSDSSLFLLLDDFEYEPADGITQLTGYDIYRNGDLLTQSIVASGSWIDTYLGSTPIEYYNITPVLLKNGIETRGIMSNTAYVTSSGIDESISENGRIFVDNHSLNVIGFRGNTIEVYDLTGHRITVVPSANNHEHIELDKGIYLVKIDTLAVKVLVK